MKNVTRITNAKAKGKDEHQQFFVVHPQLMSLFDRRDPPYQPSTMRTSTTLSTSKRTRMQSIHLVYNQEQFSLFS